MTLNDLLFEAAGLNAFIPDRRHSMISSFARASTSSITEPSTRLVLQNLLNNVRIHEAQGEMVETQESATDLDLLCELQTRVKGLSQSMAPVDASLANALVSLLLNLNRLSDLHISMPQSSNQVLNEGPSSFSGTQPAINVFDTLTRQLSDLQIERLSLPFAAGASPLVAVETALLWSRIDSELENVVSLCKQRTDILPQFMQDNHPPEYDFAVHNSENPPDYEVSGRASIDDTKPGAGRTAQVMAVRSADEKMRLDLEAVTAAIDRLYLVAPQLHNQRVELKSSKLAEMEKARREGRTAISQQDSRTRDKERDIKELENILDLLGKASKRTLSDQAVLLDDMQGRMEKIHQKKAAQVRVSFKNCQRCVRPFVSDTRLSNSLLDTRKLVEFMDKMRSYKIRSKTLRLCLHFRSLCVNLYQNRNGKKTWTL